ncbi:MAG: LacI family transcriptional regulator [Lentisphaerae bacterium]|nr:LacI family transcriptional regulator [Lentisphaerota bacterium]
MKTDCKRVLLKDIAALAGCSLAAASRALSPDPLLNRLVSAETMQAVKNAAQQLAYRPRRSRQRRALGIVGVFIPQGNTILSLDLLNAITAVANQANTPIHCYSNADSASFNHFINNYADSHHALGVVSYYPPDERDVPAFMDMFDKLRQNSAPLVVIHNNAPDNFPAVTVKFDNYYGGKLAGEYLKSLDCREYYILGGSVPGVLNPDDYLQQRLMGCYNALSSNLSTSCHMLINNQGQSFEHLQDVIGRFYRMVDWKCHGPVGIFCDNDRLALILHSFLQYHKTAVGSQAKIVGYNDEEISQYVYPPLTTVRQPFDELGKAAMLKLFNMMQGKSEKSLLIRPTLIKRSSA